MFDFGGPNAAVVSGLPSGTLAVIGERTADGARWRFLDVVADERAPVAAAAPVGELIVDEARVMFADLDALAAWKQDESTDGLADVAFWGRDADALAAQHGAGKLPEGVWGWAGLPVAQAEERMRALLAAREGGAKFMPDYRPHSHHFAVMAQVRAHPMELGHAVVDGKLVFAAMTSWGDGRFPVLALRDAAGKVVGVRVVLSRESGPEATGVGRPLGVMAGMPGLPPTPQQAAQAALAQAATDVAESALRRAVVGQLKQVLPRPLWPLIPGERGDVGENLKAAASRRMWAAVSGCALTVAFFAVFGVAVLGVLAVIAYAVVTSLP
jgi:hypothetical protein